MCALQNLVIGLPGHRTQDLDNNEKRNASGLHELQEYFMNCMQKCFRTACINASELHARAQQPGEHHRHHGSGCQKEQTYSDDRPWKLIKSEHKDTSKHTRTRDTYLRRHKLNHESEARISWPNAHARTNFMTFFKH